MIVKITKRDKKMILFKGEKGEKGEIELINLNTRKYVENKLFSILKKNQFINPLNNTNSFISLHLFFHNYILIENERIKINKKLDSVERYCDYYEILGVDRFDIMNELRKELLNKNWNLMLYCDIKNMVLDEIFNNWKFYKNDKKLNFLFDNNANNI